MEFLNNPNVLVILLIVGMLLGFIGIFIFSFFNNRKLEKNIRSGGRFAKAE